MHVSLLIYSNENKDITYNEITLWMIGISICIKAQKLTTVKITYDYNPYIFRSLTVFEYLYLYIRYYL
jgi:hypothetical protein